MRNNTREAVQKDGSLKKSPKKGTGVFAGGLQVLLLAAGLLFAQAQDVRAVDFKVAGEWVVNFDYGQNGNFTGGNGQTGYNGSQDEFDAKQRLRIQVDAVVSEYLSGTVFFEIGETTWGDAPTGGALGTDQPIIEVRRAYIDWTIPDTNFKVRMGLQGAGPFRTRTSRFAWACRAPLCQATPWQSRKALAMTLQQWPSAGSSTRTWV